MSLFSVFNTAGSGMSAESIRLNTVSSNLANANTVSSSAEKTYRARQPIFSAALEQARYGQRDINGNYNYRDPDSVPVRVDGIVESQKPLNMIYDPNHPMANADGYIFKPNVNPIEEMANMISTSQAYQSNVQVADVSKQMLMKTLQMGR